MNIYMKRKTVTTTLCLLFFFLPISAQKKRINSDWEFQRLSQEQRFVDIKNQGSDWSSQYNVEHIQAENKELTVHPDTLAVEFAQLANRSWEAVTLPHTPFVENLVVLHQWQGICYYRKQIEINKKDEDKQLWLEFEGAMQLADIWINGKHVMQHIGGYTPFVVDATGLLKSGTVNEVLVRLDNRNNPLIPPGKPLESLDFCYYGGLYRDVSLIVKPSVHITHPILANRKAGGGVFVTYPQISEQKAVIEVALQLANKEAENKKIDLHFTLYEWNRQIGKGKKAAEVKSHLVIAAHDTVTTNQQIHLATPRLWYPDSPALYILSVELMDGKRVIEKEEHRIGIRHLEMSREKGFLINGKPLKLVGTNRHMEYPYVGNAISDRAQYRDMYQIRSNGFNTVRLGHYPQDVSVLDACDELGLLVIEPIPGWQFFNKNPLFIAQTLQDIRDLIRRDRNHPSIIIWETTLNESWPPNEWKKTAIEVAHEEYPGSQCFTAGDTYGFDGFDVCYNDWEESFNRPNKTNKPGFIREYYDYEFGGHYSSTRIRRGDGDRALMQNVWNAQWSHNRYNAYYPQTMGAAVWSMYDYNRGCCDNICYSGTADVFRLPKFSLPFFRSQLPAGHFLPDGPMKYELFIASHRLKGMSDTLQVYGNVEEVELWLNGTKIARKHADAGIDSPYTPLPDGGNCRNLTSPPFTFTGVPPQEGELKAVGYQNGKVVAEYSVQTPGEADQLSISYFESGMPASKDDVLIVYVNLFDRAGIPVFQENSQPIYLEVLKGGIIMGPSSMVTEAGVASFIVQTNRQKELKLKATNGRLEALKTIILKSKKN